MRYWYKYKNILLLFFAIDAAGLAVSLHFALPAWATYLFIGFMALSLGIWFSLTLLRHDVRESQSKDIRLSHWNDITYRVKKAGEHAFADIPLGIIVYNETKSGGNTSRTIEWANERANEFFATEDLVGMRLENISRVVSEQASLVSSFTFTMFGRVYAATVSPNRVLYIEDITAVTAIESNYASHRLVLGILVLDNYDQSMQKLDAQKKKDEATRISGLIEAWCAKYDIYQRSYRDDQYLLVMDRAQLALVKKEDFQIIQTINETAEKNDYFLHVTIGLAAEEGASATRLALLAESAIQNAHDKGGNQVAISEDGHLDYRGARLSSYENTSPTYIRLKAEELFGLITSVPANGVIYIMTHKWTDTDAFGAGIALSRMTSALGRTARIVIDPDKLGATVHELYQRVNDEHQNMKSMFTTSEEAKRAMGPDDFLIIADVSKPEMFMNPAVYDQALKKKIATAVVDHHRNDKIASFQHKYIYINPAGSSSVEMIVEMIAYLPARFDITPFEANLLLSGIIVDTTSYTVHMSYRTYNVLSTLQKWGADTSTAQTFLRDDREEFELRREALSKARFINNRYAVVTTGEANVKNEEQLSKIADELSRIAGIDASFCLGMVERGGVDVIALKARSLGIVDCEAFVRKNFGGGGHANSAAAIIGSAMTPAIPIEECEKRLEEILKSFTPDETQTKLILRKSYRDEDDIMHVPGEEITLASGLAKNLIKENIAILATIDNAKQIEREVNQQETDAQNERKSRLDLKEKIEASPITVFVPLKTTGAIDGVVDVRVIAERLKAEHGIEVSTDALRIPERITSIGDKTVIVRLARDIQATLKVEVRELEKKDVAAAGDDRKKEKS